MSKLGRLAYLGVLCCVAVGFSRPAAAVAERGADRALAELKADGALDVTAGLDAADTGRCPAGEIEDCNGNCAPDSWVGDGVCDDGSYTWGGLPIYFNCDEFGCDGGDCDPAEHPDCSCTDDSHCVDANSCNGEEWCDLGTGECQAGTPMPDGTPCEDDVYCTINEQCWNGRCSDVTIRPECIGPAPWPGAPGPPGAAGGGLQDGVGLPAQDMESGGFGALHGRGTVGASAPVPAAGDNDPPGKNADVGAQSDQEPPAKYGSDEAGQIAPAGADSEGNNSRPGGCGAFNSVTLVGLSMSMLAWMGVRRRRAGTADGG